MIEFKGEITGRCKKFLMAKQIKIQTTATSITIALFLIPLILVAYYWNVIALIFLIPLALLLVFSLMPPGKNAQKLFIPKRVYIDTTEETIVNECEKMERFRMLNSVKEILDYGEWYYFIFNYEDRDPYFICQKDLLTQGTLEEFEALFEGKIVDMSK